MTNAHSPAACLYRSCPSQPGSHWCLCDDHWQHVIWLVSVFTSGLPSVHWANHSEPPFTGQGYLSRPHIVPNTARASRQRWPRRYLVLCRNKKELSPEPDVRAPLGGLPTGRPCGVETHPARRWREAKTASCRQTGNVEGTRWDAVERELTGGTLGYGSVGIWFFFGLESLFNGSVEWDRCIWRSVRGKKRSQWPCWRCPSLDLDLDPWTCSWPDALRSPMACIIITFATEQISAAAVCHWME